MKSDLEQVGIVDPTFRLTTVQHLVDKKVLFAPIDGNHGEIHPKGDDFQSSGVPFIMASDIRNGVIDYRDCKFISAQQAESLRKGFALNGDVLLTHKATIGETAIVDYRQHPFVMLTPQVTYYRIVDSDVLHNQYLRYYFESSLFQGTLRLWAGSGATRAYLGITGQQKLPVVVPPIEKQRQIANVISNYDNLIAVGRKRIANLERLANEVFKEWFARLRFPGHGDAEFESGIPKSWDVVETADFCEKVFDGTHDTPKPTNVGYPLVTGRHITKGEIDFSSTYKICEDDYVEISRRSGLNQWDIIYSNIGTLGTIALVSGFTKYSVKNVIVFRPKDKFQSLYLYRLLQQPHVIELMHMFSSGASQQFISLGTARTFPIFDPGDELVEEFGRLAEPIEVEIQKLREVNSELQLARSLLLGRLISGKLSVEDLELRGHSSSAEPGVDLCREQLAHA